MIISHSQYNATPDIDVTIYSKTKSQQPFIVRVTDGMSVHMSHQDASRLHLQLTAALYEYEETDNA